MTHGPRGTLQRSWPWVLFAASAPVACTTVSVPSTHPCRISEFTIGEHIHVLADTGDLVHQECGIVDLDVAPVADGDVRVTWSDGALSADGTRLVIVPTVTAGASGASLHALVLDGSASTGDDAGRLLWRQGYQSWSWSGIVDLDATDAPDRDALGLPPVGGDGDALSVTSETPWTSWWGGAVSSGDDAVGFALGVAGATQLKGWTAFDRGHATLVLGGRDQTLVLAPDEARELDPVVIAIADSGTLALQSWVDEVAARHPLTDPGAPVGELRAPPDGWASWYVFYEAVTEADIRRNLDVLASDAPDAAVLQIDDGWQVRWGEWTAGDDFPSGMASLASAIRTAGFTPGVWMAPFYVSRDAPAYAAHPDWWVRTSDGSEELRFTNVGTGDYAVVDATVPEARAWMAQQVADRVDEGFGYLKLDFLYAGAQEGTRALPVTGLEAYTLGMDAIRAAAGDAWILACGAPLLPTVGYAQSFRSGADIAFSPDGGRPKRDYLRWQVRQTAARGVFHRAWWFNDADQILMRAPFSATDATGAIVANVVSGGTWLLGDDLAVLDPTLVNLGLRDDLRRFRGVTSTPDAPWSAISGLDGSPLVESITPDDAPPVRWMMSTGHVAALNLTDAPVDVELPRGRELIAQGTWRGGLRTLAPGEGVLVLPDDVTPVWPVLAGW